MNPTPDGNLGPGAEAARRQANADLPREARRYQKALADYDLLLEAHPDHAGVWKSKGDVLSALEQLEEALSCYERAIELDRQYAAAWSSAALALSVMGREEEALAHYDRALQLQASPAQPPPVQSPSSQSTEDRRPAAGPAAKKPDMSRASPVAAVGANEGSTWLDEADRLRKEGRYEEALPYYREASRASLRILSRAYQGQDEDVIEIMQRKVEHCRQAIAECRRRLDD